MGNAAALLAVALVAGFSSYAVYTRYGQDFRGFYAAAKVLLAGGDPYDYGQVAQVLKRLTGYAGNNPYYYPPWFSLAMIPLAALLPLNLARGAWILLNWVFFVVGMLLAFDALGWDIRGWRRWTVVLSAFYLFGWVSLKFEQTGILLFLCLAWTLRSLRYGKDMQVGIGMALLLTKPNVSLLAFMLLALSFARRRRKAAVWSLAGFLSLTAVGTAFVPGWITSLFDPSFGAGLTSLLDGPGQVVRRRRICTLLHWLEGFGITGPAAWAIYGALVLAALWLFVRAWRGRYHFAYQASLGSALTLLITPYALLYDYSMLIVGLLWTYKNLRRLSGFVHWLSVAILVFMFSVLAWVGPEYDGYWLALGMTALLVITWHGVCAPAYRLGDLQGTQSGGETARPS